MRDELDFLFKFIRNFERSTCVVDSNHVYVSAEFILY